MTRERRAAERLACKGFGALLLLLLALWAIPQVWDKLSPFIISIPLAAALQPVIRFLSNKLRFRRSLAVLICVLLMLAAMLGITYWLIGIIIEQAPQLVTQTEGMLSDAMDTVQRMSERLMQNEALNGSPQMQKLLKDAAQQAVSHVAQMGSQMATDMVSFTVNMVMSLPYYVVYISFLAMALYFITNHYSEIRSYLPGGKRRRQDSNTTQLTNSAIRSLMGYLRVQGTFAVIVFVVSAVTLRIFQFKNPTMLALIAGIMEMVPMVGSGLLYIMMSIIYFLSGSTAMGFQVLALTGALQLLRRVLEPKLMSDSIGITPLQSLIGMFVGMQFGGILGLIGGPVLMSVLVGAVHGNMLKSMNDDLYIVVKWVKQRWSERNIDPEPETEPEETLQKEPDPGQDPDAEPKAEADKPTGEKEPADGKE